MTDIREEFIKDLYKIGVVKKEKVTYSSGAEGGNYFDGRIFLGYPKLSKEYLPYLMSTLPKNKNYNVIAGCVLGGALLANKIADKLPYCEINLPIRSGKKEHGMKNIIEGPKEKMLKLSELEILIVDDVVNSGRSIEKAADEIIKYLTKNEIKDYNLTLWSVIFYENEKVKQKLKKKYNCEFNYFITDKEILNAKI